MQSQTFHIGGDGGISIAAEATGNADALPVLLAHGGGASARNHSKFILITKEKYATHFS